MLRRMVVAGAGMALLTVTGVAAAASASTTPPDSTPPSSAGSSVPVDAPTTTLDPVAAEEAAVSDATVSARAALVVALANPGDPAAIAALDDHYVAGAAARQQIDTNIQTLLDAGQHHAPDPNVADTLTVESVALDSPPPAPRATVTACVVEAAVVFEEAPESSDAVAVGNNLRAFRAEYALVNQDGHWKVESATSDQEWPGETACPVDEEALITRRVQEIDAISLSAYLDPSAPDIAERLDSIYTEGGETRQVIESDLQTLRDEGLVGQLHPTIPRSITVEDITILDGPPGDARGCDGLHHRSEPARQSWRAPGWF